MIYKYAYLLSSHAFSRTQLLLKKYILRWIHKSLHDLHIYYSIYIHQFVSLKICNCVRDRLRIFKAKSSYCLLASDEQWGTTMQPDLFAFSSQWWWLRPLIPSSAQFIPLIFLRRASDFCCRSTCAEFSAGTAPRWQRRWERTRAQQRMDGRVYKFVGFCRKPGSNLIKSTGFNWFWTKKLTNLLAPVFGVYGSTHGHKTRRNLEILLLLDFQQAGRIWF
jgi:hypothetical protein